MRSISMTAAAALAALAFVVGCEEQPAAQPTTQAAKPSAEKATPKPAAEKKPEAKKLTPEQLAARTKECFAAMDAKDEKKSKECYADKAKFEMVDSVPANAAEGYEAMMAS